MREFLAFVKILPLFFLALSSGSAGSGITATSILSAVLIGLLIASLTLILTNAACFVRCLNDCD